MSTTKASYVNLHTNSFYSFLHGLKSPKDLCAAAAEKGMHALALTDRHGGYGLIDFYQQAEKHEIQPIFGVEIALAKDSRFEHRQGLDGTEGHIVLLAITQQGYQNLLEIISAANIDGYFHQPRVDTETLHAYAEGLVCLTGSHE